MASEPPPLPPRPVSLSTRTPDPAVGVVPATCTATHPAAKARRPFAVQAALFSLYAAPAAVAARHYAAADAAPSVGRHVAVVCLGVLAVGLLLGLAALVAMPWAGWRRVLVRATIGVLLNGTALGTAAWERKLDVGLTFWGPIGPDPKRLVGQWARRYTENGWVVTNTVNFKDDGTFHETYRTSYETFGDWTGLWEVKDGKLVENFDGDTVKVGTKHTHHHGPLGTVRVSGTRELILLGHGGQELRFAKRSLNGDDD